MQQLVFENSIQNNVQQEISESVIVLNEAVVMCVVVRRALFDLAPVRYLTFLTSKDDFLVTAKNGPK